MCTTVLALGPLHTTFAHPLLRVPLCGEPCPVAAPGSLQHPLQPPRAFWPQLQPQPEQPAHPTTARLGLLRPPSLLAGLRGSHCLQPALLQQDELKPLQLAWKWVVTLAAQQRVQLPAGPDSELLHLLHHWPGRPAPSPLRHCPLCSQHASCSRHTPTERQAERPAASLPHCPAHHLCPPCLRPGCHPLWPLCPHCMQPLPCHLLSLLPGLWHAPPLPLPAPALPRRLQQLWHPCLRLLHWAMRPPRQWPRQHGCPAPAACLCLQPRHCCCCCCRRQAGVQRWWWWWH